MESFSDGVPLRVIRCRVVKRDVLLTKLLEGQGFELASVFQDDAVWASKVCDVLCQCLNNPLCVFGFSWVELYIPTEMIYNTEHISVTLTSCNHVSQVNSYSLMVSLLKVTLGKVVVSLLTL